MALFETKNVTIALETLTISEADDRWRGVEPYIIPIFYKVDGEGYEAVLSIFNTIQPREGTTEVEEDGNIQFSVNSLQPNPNQVETDNPIIYVPPGSLLDRGQFDSGETVDISDIFYTTDLVPIPFKIDVLGIANEGQLLDALSDLLVSDSEVGNAFNTIFLSLNDFLASLIGLDERLESCPSILDDGEDFVNNIEAMFNCLIPGTVGGVFVFMENDEFSESNAKDLRSSVRDEVATILNDTINAIALNNPIPDPEDQIDPAIIEDNVISDMTLPVLASIGFSVGAIIIGALTFNIALVIYGLFSAIAWIAGGPDDMMGQHQVSFSHMDLTETTDSIEINANMEEDGDNFWVLKGSFRVNN